jgi:hypothetical protein
VGEHQTDGYRSRTQRIRASAHRKGEFTLTPDPQGAGRTIFVGADDEIRQDIAAVREMGAHEIEFDPSTGAQGNTLESWLESMERMQVLADPAA